LITLLLAMHPIEMWIRRGCLQEDMIYRLLFCSLLGSIGVTLTSAWQVSECLHELTGNRRSETLAGAAAKKLYSLHGLGLTTLLALPLLAWLAGPGVWTFVTAGEVQIHWSRIVLAGLIVFTLCHQALTALVLNLIHLHAMRLHSTRAVDRVITASCQADSRQSDLADLLPT
jgi:hypothetical protein